ncbi:MAG: acylphosphatase [Desulfuromonadales bacterium]|nr:acylphosphatase [Desulfuromonadales bacterium]MBN2792755.1 acylphosphatase [Desulfuromonadales bacterium]
MKTVRAHLLINGRVQGVWFRQSTRNKAQQQAVTGWCRNNPSGSVEVVLEGDKAAVLKVIEWCRQGPELARVDSIDISWESPLEEFSDFRIL